MMAKARLKVGRLRRDIILVSLLQFCSLALFLTGWLWALIISIMLLRDAYIYKKTPTNS